MAKTVKLTEEQAAKFRLGFGVVTTLTELVEGLITITGEYLGTLNHEVWNDAAKLVGYESLKDVRKDGFTLQILDDTLYLETKEDAVRRKKEWSMVADNQEGHGGSSGPVEVEGASGSVSEGEVRSGE